MELDLEEDLFPMLTAFLAAVDPFHAPDWEEWEAAALSQAVVIHSEWEEAVKRFVVHQFIEAVDGTWVFAGGNGKLVWVFIKPAEAEDVQLLLNLAPHQHAAKDYRCTRLDFHADVNILVVTCESSGAGGSRFGQVRVLQNDQLVYSYDEAAPGSTSDPLPRTFDALYDSAQGTLWLLSVRENTLRRILLHGEVEEVVIASSDATAMLDLWPDCLLLGASSGRFWCISRASLQTTGAWELQAAGYHPPTQLLSGATRSFVCVGAVADETHDDREDLVSALHGHILCLVRDQTGKFCMSWRHDIPDYVPSVRTRLPWLTCWEREGNAWVAYLGGEAMAELRILDANGNMQVFPLGVSRFHALGIQVSQRSGHVIVTDGTRLRFFRG